MGDPLAVDRCCQWLSGIRLYGQVLSLSPSKQLHLIDSSSSTYHLSDGSCSFIDYSNSRNHRFTSQKMAAMNRLQKPNRVLHYYNAPISFTEEHIGDVCRRNDLSPLSIKVYFKVFSVETFFKTQIFRYSLCEIVKQSLQAVYWSSEAQRMPSSRSLS